MIKTITYEEVIKLLRLYIIENTNIDENKVLNGLAIRGTDLADIISSTELYSFSTTDTIILFELLRDQMGDNYVTPKNDNDMLVITSYKYHLMIYGNGSDICLQKLRAMFKNPTIAQELRQEGIYIRTVDEGEEVNEFINNTMLLRNDLNIYIEVVYNIHNSKEQEYFDSQLKDIMLTIDEI